MPEDKKCLIPPQKLQQLEQDQPPLIFPGKQRPHGGESRHLILEIYFRWTISNFKNPVGKHASTPTNQRSKGEQMQKERHTEHRLPTSLLRSKFSQLALCTFGDPADNEQLSLHICALTQLSRSLARQTYDSHPWISQVFLRLKRMPASL